VIVAICPLDNAFATASNLAEIDRQLAYASRGGAQLAVFPECGLTGFKARKDLTHAHITDALAQAQRLVVRHGVATLLPSTELDRSGRPRNRARLFAADGMPRATFEKTGLTPSERLWFVAGTSMRRRTFLLDGLRFGVLFCDEINQGADRFVTEPVDAMLWPGYWGYEDAFDWEGAGAHDCHTTLRTCAHTFNAPLLQANYRRADVEPTRQNVVVMGGSLAVAPDGTLLHAFEPRRRQPLLIKLPHCRHGLDKTRKEPLSARRTV
jgi:predicted amidohydrolase